VSSSHSMGASDLVTFESGPPARRQTKLGPIPAAKIVSRGARIAYPVRPSARDLPPRGRTNSWFSRAVVSATSRGCRSVAKAAPAGRLASGAGGAVTQRAVRPRMVVLEPPGLDLHARFVERVEDLAAQELVAHAARAVHARKAVGEQAALKVAAQLGAASTSSWVMSSGMLDTVLPCGS
jgi:hypothetical protein